MPPDASAARAFRGWAVLISTAYALLGGAWVAGGHLLGVAINDDRADDLFELATGLGFVGVTSVALYTLLHRARLWRTPAPDSGGSAGDGAPSAIGGRGASSRRRTIAAATIIVLLPLTVLIATLARLYDDALRAAGREVAGLAEVIDEQTTRSIHSIELLLDAIAALEDQAPADAVQRRAWFRAILLSRLDGLPYVKAVRVLDQDGRVIGGTEDHRVDSDRSERPELVFQPSGANTRLSITRPASTGNDGNALVAFSRTIDDVDGALRRVIVADIDPHLIARAWRALDLGPRSAVALSYADGTPLVRRPVVLGSADGSFADSLSSVLAGHLAHAAAGSFRAISRFDGIDRLVAYRSLERYPTLVVTVGHAVADALGEWRQAAALSFGIWLTAATVLAVMTLHLLRQMHLRAIAEHNARSSDLFPTENPNPVLRIDPNGQPILANPAAHQLMDRLSRAPAAALSAWRLALTRAGRATEGELFQFDDDDAAYSFVVSPIADGGFVNLYGIDVTALRQSEAKRRAAEQRLALALEAVNDGVWDWDVSTGRVDFSARLETMLGYGEGELTPHVSSREALVHPDDRPAVTRAIEDLLSGRADAYETRHRLRTKSGGWFWVLDRGRVIERDADGRAIRAIGTHSDIHRHEQLLADLAKQKTMFEIALDQAVDAIVVVDATGRYVFANQAARRISRRDPLGLPPNEAGSIWGRLTTLDDRPVAPSEFVTTRALRGELTVGEVLKFTKPDGTPVVGRFSCAPLRATPEGIVGAVATMSDITDRLRSEASLTSVNRALRASAAINHAIGQPHGRDTLMAEICRVLVDKAGYHSVFICELLDDADHTLRVAAAAGPDAEWAAAQRRTWSDGPFGEGPTGQAARLGRPVVLNALLDRPESAAWHAGLAARGIRSAAASPILIGDRVAYTLTLLSREIYGFHAIELEILASLGTDIGAAFRVMDEIANSEAERHVAKERLHQTFIQAIGALTAAIETRDPYTAGHQMHMAELAAAIARRLGLGDEHVEGIRLGGMLHDIGKIGVPSEILSKPGLLNEVEMALVRLHPQLGYDIVKDVQFAWPIAQMVLQHHERIDGSGYPLGLKGEDIAIESRIIAVADVVEAMATHRPYRPALAFEQVAAELERGRGSLYDPSVVDACLEVLRSQRFSWLRRPTAA